MKQIRTAILFGTLAVFLYMINAGIVRSEQHIANGQIAYFELAPLDPRSLIQGDYMQLRYQVEQDMRDADFEIEDQGQIVMNLDNDDIARFDRFYQDGDSLAEDEILFNYRIINQSRIHIGVDSFFFQEGQAEAYEAARYAEVRILTDGRILLIDLVDENLQSITP